MMDMSPFANNNPQSMSPGTPDYLKQDQNGTGPGVVNNMVKALMDGHSKYMQQGGSKSPSMGDGSWFGNSSVGGAPLAGQRGVAPSLAGAPSPAPTMAPAPAMTGAPAPPPQPDNLSFGGGVAPVPFAPTMNDPGPSPGMVGGNGNLSGGFPGMPNGMSDPTVNALFSQIPGGGPFG